MGNLPGGAESLLEMVSRNPFAVIECGSRNFIRLRGFAVEGSSFRAGVFESVRHRLPATVRVFSPSMYGGKEYAEALQRSWKGPATSEARRLPCGTLIEFYGRRRVVDVHNMRAGRVLVVTDRGEFELDAAEPVKLAPSGAAEAPHYAY